MTDASGARIESTTRFTECDHEGATIESESGAHRVTWSDLQAHASFPAAATHISREVITTPLGTFGCLLYVVRRDEETLRFWFAEDLPGMPIKHETVVGDKVISTTTVVSNVT